MDEISVTRAPVAWCLGIEWRYDASVEQRMQLLHAIAGGRADAPLPVRNAVSAGPHRVLWDGPHRWLAWGGEAAGGAESALQRIRAACGNVASVVDVSHGWSRFRIGGRAAVMLLAKGCDLDLQTRDGAGTAPVWRTRFAEVPALLWRDGEDGFHELLVARSYSAWIADWLDDACLEFRSTQRPSAAHGAHDDR
jgi:sarcosine oxidase subunit gamma